MGDFASISFIVGLFLSWPLFSLLDAVPAPLLLVQTNMTSAVVSSHQVRSRQEYIACMMQNIVARVLHLHSIASQALAFSLFYKSYHSECTTLIIKYLPHS